MPQIILILLGSIKWRIIQIIEFRTYFWLRVLDDIRVLDGIFQSGITGVSDHQLILCTRKEKRVIFSKHNNVFLRFLKHHTVNVFVEALRKVNFSNYERFSRIDAAYTDFRHKLINNVNEIVPGKEIRIKNNTHDWFDRKIPELIHAREKYFLSSKKPKLHIDQENHKKVKYQV